MGTGNTAGYDYDAEVSYPFDLMADIQYRSILRDACHYNLYAIVTSSAMNGIDVNESAIRNTAPWQAGLGIDTGAFGVCR